jgi:hypothetical protein
MTQLYTVTMVREQRITKYDARGRKMAEEIKKIPIVFHDLPAQTANMYAREFPNAEVKISAQAITRDPIAREKLGGGGFKKSARQTAQRLHTPVSEDKVGAAAVAAAAGDFTAAINAEMKEIK